MSMTATRLEIRRRLGRQWSDVMWDYLLELQAVAPTMTNEEVDYAVRLLRGGLQLQRASGGDTYRAATAASRRREAERLTAISSLLAHEAAADDDVVAIRGRVGTLLDWADVESWVRGQAAADGSPTRWLEVPLPDASTLTSARAGFRVAPPIADGRAFGIRRRDLAYLTPGHPQLKRRPVVLGGLLDDLRAVSDALSMRYGWEPAQAATWLLTGIPPALPSMVGQERLTSSSYGATRRIVLTIDPATPARNVTAFYRQVRGRARQRALQPKHYRLATFIADASLPRRWADRMAMWNRDHPSWRYDHPGNFARDCRAATRRVLQPRN